VENGCGCFRFQRRFIERTYSDDSMVRQAILSAPRGQGKTSLTAGLAFVI